jgi:uncharacterized repeat protein (TIGR03803 family)
MRNPLPRLINISRRQPQPRALNGRKVTSGGAAIFVIALLLAMPVRDAYSSASNSAIYSFGTTQPVDGAVPKGSLTYVNGLLFGRTTTVTSGCVESRDYGRAVTGDGVIFHFDSSNVTASYSIDHIFSGNPDGENPRHDAMTPFNGELFGTTLQGGTKNNGIIFSVSQTGTGYANLVSLTKSHGDESHSCFVVNNLNNLLYGMTASGGDNDGGVIFSFDPTTSTYQTLYSFHSSTGHEPHGRLTLDPNGTTLYGMTRQGGSEKYGVVFSFDTTTNNYTVLHDFIGGPNDGATSDHGYVVQAGNVLYGMTTDGGLSSNGVIFSLTTDGTTFQLLHKFGSIHHDGKNPYGSLLLVGNQLYGTTANGGDYGMGTVFVINTDGTGYSRLHNFGGTKHDGVKPIDNVILLNGALYGMTTEGGDFDQGTIFSVPSS